MPLSIRVPIENDNPSIVRWEEKCIRCGMCKEACTNLMGVHGTYTLEQTGGKAICIYCGQCANVCPVDSITERDETSQVQKAIADPDKVVVVSTSPAVRASLGEEFGLEPGAFVEGKMVALLRALGVDYVLDTNFAADLTIVEVSCAEGDTGNIYEGLLEVKTEQVVRGALPEIPVKIMMNVGNPQLAFDFQSIPNQGVGLARLEFIINNNIGIHPKVVLEYPNVPGELRDAVERLSAGYPSAKAFFERKIAEGVATIAAAFYPKKVIVRLSDFKSNEYRKLIGGANYEPVEENPMLGFRGASRYIANSFAECFAMECRAMKFVRDEMGLTNVELMIPFVRTVEEARRVTEIMEQHGLKRGVNGLRLNMMCEIPSNALLAEQFLEYFDGFSIGSNDMTQLALGLDRDSGLVAATFDERNPAVKALLSMAIRACRAQGKYVGICGQGPSDHADLAKWLMDEGIESISLNPDTVVDTWRRLARGS